MRIEDVMRRQVRALKPDEQVGLYSFARLHELPLLPVADSHGHLLGVVTRLSLLQALLQAESLQVALPAKEAMTREATRLHTVDPVEQAVDVMIVRGVHALPVLDEHGRLAGLVSDADLLQALAEEHQSRRAFLSAPVEAVMTPEPFTLGPDAPLEDAVGLMVEKGVRHLPIVDDDGKLLGIVSERDLRTRIGMELQAFDRATPEAAGIRMSEVIGPDPISLSKGARLSEAIEILASERIGAVPVVDEQEHVLGIVSYVDVLEWLLGSERTRAPVTSELQPGLS
jgi:CBS domain-containing protein